MKKQIKKILICISTAEHSKNALSYAINLANKHGYVIEILSILDTTGKNYRGLFSIEKTLKKEQRVRIEEEINLLAATVPDNIRVIVNIKEGFITEEISQTISNDKNIKMLVLSSSTNSHSNGKLIPYITEKLADRYFIPTMIIPSTLTNTEILCLS